MPTASPGSACASRCASIAFSIAGNAASSLARRPGSENEAVVALSANFCVGSGPSDVRHDGCRAAGTDVVQAAVNRAGNRRRAVRRIGAMPHTTALPDDLVPAFALRAVEIVVG